MRIRMQTLECGPDGTFEIGDEREVSDAHGRALISGRHAEEIKQTRESAMIEAPEHAVMPKAKAKKSVK